MLENINSIAVIGTTLLMLAVATIWYSLLPWGSHVGAHADAKKERSTTMRFVITVVCYGLLVACIAAGEIVALKLQIEPLVLAFMASTFVSIFFVALTVDEHKGYVYYLTHCGFVYVFIMGTMMTVHNWPW